MKWLESPCAECSDSPCCRNLPITTLQLNNSEELETALAFLEYGTFRLGLKDDGLWMLFHSRPCMHLDEGTSKCRLYGKPERPRTCCRYPAYFCWYERTFRNDGIGLEFLLLDRPRLARLKELLVFDVSGEIAGVPSWEDMIETLGKIPLDASIPGERPREGAERKFAFNTGVPCKRSHFDLFRFRLGFPGVRLGIGRDAWYTIVSAAAGEALGHDERCRAYFLTEDLARDLDIGGVELLDAYYDKIAGGS
jgi:Fe-S-cluster containining protein